MAWKPAIPAEEYARYFSITELSVIFKTKTESVSKMVNTIAREKNKLIRVAYRPTDRAITRPETLVHLDDVLKYGPEFGITVPRQWVEEVIEMQGWSDRKWKVDGLLAR